MTEHKWQIHYTGAPHADSSYGDCIAKGSGIASCDRAWAENGCQGMPLDYTIYIVADNGRLMSLSEFYG